MIAEALNDSGLYMVLDFYKKGTQISWTKESVKYGIFHPIMIAMFKKKSSAELTDREACQIIEEIIRFLGEECKLTVEFPNKFWNYYEKKE